MLLMTKHELYIKLLIVRADAKPVKTSKSFRRDIRLELVRRPEDLRVAAHADLDEYCGLLNVRFATSSITRAICVSSSGDPCQ